jgi:hypothetical protein
MAVGFPLKTTYADGDVYSASDVNDTNGTINLLTSSTLSVAAGKNAVIGGGMDIWQRGTSVAISTIGYTADRFVTWSTGGAATTTSRQATNDTTNLPSIEYCARVQRNSGQTITNAIAYQSSFETVNSIPLVGKTVVFSFYARAGANFSATSNALSYAVLTGTGTDQNVTSYTGSAAPINATATLTTTWQRFQGTATLSSSAKEVGIQISYTPTGTASTNDYFEITGVQLELGSTATTFSRAGGTIQGELAACQRYYLRVTAANEEPISNQGYFFSATSFAAMIPHKVEMRVAPTVLDFSQIAVTNINGFYSEATTCTLPRASRFQSVLSAGGLSGGSTGSAYGYLAAFNAGRTGYIGLSAEL